MATNRQYEPATIFGPRIVDMRHLWNPSTEYLGKPTTKPNHFATFITPKTQAHWSTEPIFGGVMVAFGKLLQGQLQAFQQNPGAATWPINDGDAPSADGKSSEFAKGHWIFTASTGNPPNIELAQAGGTLVKLQNRVGVKPGDFTVCGVTAAVKQNDARGVKFYLNAVVFTAPGEEIVFANSVSGSELMAQAQRQGMHVAGFAPGGAGGFGGAPQGGFTQAPQGGFHGSPPQGQPQGFAPTNTAPGAFVAAPAPGGTPGWGGGNATSPSNSNPQGGWGR